MAPFPKSVQHAMRRWLFQHNLDDIDAAYRAAANAHTNRDVEIEEMVRQRLGLATEDPFPEWNDGDDEDPIGRLYDDAGEMEERATRGAHLVRKAFLIALFHHWERHCNSQMGKAAYINTEVEKWLESEGRDGLYNPLRQLQNAANCAKHGPGKACKLLFEDRPDLFPTARTGADARTPRSWSANIPWTPSSLSCAKQVL